VVQAVASKVGQQVESRVEDAAAKARATEEAKQFLAQAGLEAQSEPAMDDGNFANHLAHLKEVATAKKILAESAEKTSNVPGSGPQLKQSSSSSEPQELADVDKAQSTMRKSAAQEMVASAAPKTPDAANDQGMVKSKARTPVRAPGIHTALRSQAKKASVSTEAVEAMTAADAAEVHGPQKELQRQQKNTRAQACSGKGPPEGARFHETAEAPPRKKSGEGEAGDSQRQSS